MKLMRLSLMLLMAGSALAADDLQPAVATSTIAAPLPVAAPAAAVPATSATKIPAPAARATARDATTGKAGPRAQDRVELENTQITGNRELPKVSYIVPWKKPGLGDFGGRPAKSLLDELLAPVDRDVFKRQNRYFDALKPDAATPRSGDEK
jgi:hypothetical protein